MSTSSDERNDTIAQDAVRATSSRLVTPSNSELGDMPPRATATVIPLVQPATVTRLPQRESRPDGVFVAPGKVQERRTRI